MKETLYKYINACHSCLVVRRADKSNTCDSANASGRRRLFRLDTFWGFPGADDRESDGTGVSVCISSKKNLNCSSTALHIKKE